MSNAPASKLGGAFVALMFAAFVESMGSFLVLALLPFYGQRFGATPTLIGWLVATFALAQLVSAPLWGRLSDRTGRKSVLLIGLAITAFAYWLFAEADSLVALFVSRAAQGLGAGTVSVVFAYLADVLPKERRAEGIGWVTAATSGAAMVGPVLGSVATRYDPSYPGYWSLALAVVSFFMVVVLLPKPTKLSLRENEKHPATVAASQSLRRALSTVLAQPLAPVSRLVWTYAVGMLATSATFGVIALYLDANFNVDEESIWKFFFPLAGASLVIRVWILGPLVRRFGEQKLIVAGLVCLGAATLGLVQPGPVQWLAAPIVLFALGQSLLYPCTTARLSQIVEQGAGLQGQAMGVQQAYGGVSRVLGPVAGGWAFAQIGLRAPFVVSGLVVLVWALVLYYLSSRATEPST